MLFDTLVAEPDLWDQFLLGIIAFRLNPIEGMSEFLGLLQENSVAYDNLKKMITTNPANLRGM